VKISDYRFARGLAGVPIFRRVIHVALRRPEKMKCVEQVINLFHAFSKELNLI